MADAQRKVCRDLTRRWRAMKVLRKLDQIEREARAIIAHKGL